ncbi:dynein axonemal assembly factor 8-like isoform X1 [Dipodomys merriami]|uniref:dynein axonemal assembly factor 8-like isoform X1 n=2 Tax=Dipodomys merriami TaxID=94247 RepID=UPI0038559CF1
MSLVYSIKGQKRSSSDDGIQRWHPVSLVSMESKDTDVPSLGSPWDAILKAAKDQLPSLDSDSSLSDDREEEPYIFQRNQPILIPDLAEELAEDSADASEPRSWGPAVKRSPSKPVLVPGGPSTEPRSGQRMWDSALWEGRGPGQPSQGCADTSTLLRMAETSSWLEGDLGSFSFNSKASQSSSCGPQGEATLSPEGKPKAEPRDEDAWKDSAKRRALRLERRKMIEKEVLQKVTWSTRDPPNQGQAEEPEPKPQASSTEAQEGQLVLSLQHLEDWDLDYILKSLPVQEDSPTDGASRSAWWLAESCQGRDNSVPRSQDRLQEQLALLCATQSKTCTAARKVPADMPQDTEEEETRSRYAVMRLGLQAEPCQRLDEGSRLNTEPPTIFMDLRPTKPWDPESQESSESSQYSSSDSEEEEETTAMGEQRDQAQQAPTSSQGPWDCTAKSRLLQQLKAFRKRVAPPELLINKGSGSQETQAPEEIAGTGTEKEEHTEPQAEELSAQARLQDRHPMALESSEVLDLGQL